LIISILEAKSVGFAGAVAVTVMLSLETIVVAKPMESIVALEEFLVLIVPEYAPVEEGVVSVFEEEKLKQYCVEGERSELGKVTIWPDTEVAVAISGQAAAPDGKLLVSTVQFEAAELTVNADGKII
jgi:hypothetical protein